MAQSDDRSDIQKTVASFNAPRVLRGTFAPAPTAIGVRPVASGPPAAVPTDLNQLPQAVTNAYDMSISAAAQASIPIAGSIGGGAERRVVILERSASVTVPVAEKIGISERWGYAIRLCITVNKVNASLKLTLPFIAASAEVGEVEAAWSLQVVGLAGPDMDAAAALPKQLNVETFVVAQQSLGALIGAVRNQSTRFIPSMLGYELSGEALELVSTDAVARSAALYGISKKWSRQRLAGYLSGPTERQAGIIADTYHDIGGVTDLGTEPSSSAAATAAHLLAQVPIRL